MEPLNPATDGASANIVDDNLATLRELFPDAFTESSDDGEPRWKVDYDALREVLGDAIEDKPERYSFTWNGKSRAKLIANTPTTATLRPCPEESVNWDTTKNLFIEGDNLEVLKLLQKSYHRKVKMIYIDPPYNTGNEFIYPDKFQENLDTYLRYSGQVDGDGLKLSANSETGGRFHTNWLNMMYPRLKLSRNLLSDDGAVFISIGDNELSNLRKLCDEIYGESNFVGIFKWNKTSKAPTLSKKIRGKLEYVLCYEKADVISLRGPDSYNTMAPLFNSGNKPTKIEFEAGTVEFYFDDGTYQQGKYGDDEKVVELHNDLEVKDGTNANAFSMTARFKWSQGTFKERLHEGQRIAFKTPTFTTMYYYLDEGDDKFIAPSDVLSSDECGVMRNDEGYGELKSLFEGLVIFDYPKPSSLPKYLIRMMNDPTAICLDFFAGAATTAHSAMELNAEDGGARRHIMVQLPEPCEEGTVAHTAGYRTIADIGKERIRRAAAKLHEDFPDFEGDLGFRVFKLDSSSVQPWDADFDTVEETLLDSIDNIKQDRTQSDVLYELLIKYGLDLAEPIDEREIAGSTVYSVGAGALVVCLAKVIDLEVVEGIVALKEELMPEVMRVVFRDSGFKDDVVKANAVQILKQAGLADEQIRSL